MNRARPRPAKPASDYSASLAPLADTLQLLGDERRLRILLALADGEQNVTALQRRLGLKQPTLSHHLGLLRMGKLVVSRREGKNVFYSVPTPAAGAGKIWVTASGFTVSVAPGA